MKSFIEFFYNPLNVLVLIILCVLLFTTLGSYKEGFTKQSNSININGIEISNTLFTGANGSTANITNNNGNYIIVVTDSSGNETQFTYNNTNNTNNTNTNNTSVSTSITPYDSPTSTNYTTNTYNQTIFYGPNGSTAELVQLNGTIVIQVTYSSVDILTFTQSNSQPSFYPNQASYSSSYYNQLNSTPTSPTTNTSTTNPSTTNTSTTNPSTTPTSPTTTSTYPPTTYPYPPTTYPYPPTTYPPSTYPPSQYPPSTYPPSTYPPSQYPPTQYPPTQYPLSLQYPSSTFNNDNDYSSSLPPAIPSSQIPPGQEDLYILKSEIVPPVCPAPITACHNKTDKCAPCPPCGRCPEPNFECKKVPNYKSDNTDLPVPFLSPYSTFGS
jgi:hypothetical protein